MSPEHLLVVYIVSSIIAPMLVAVGVGANRHRIVRARFRQILPAVPHAIASFISLCLLLLGVLDVFTDSGSLDVFASVVATLGVAAAAGVTCYYLMRFASAASSHDEKVAAAVRRRDVDVLDLRLGPMLDIRSASLMKKLNESESALRREMGSTRDATCSTVDKRLDEFGDDLESADLMIEALDNKVTDLDKALGDRVTDLDKALGDRVTDLAKKVDAIKEIPALSNLILDMLRKNTAGLNAIAGWVRPDEPEPAEPAYTIAMLEARGIDLTYINKNHVIDMMVDDFKKHKLRAVRGKSRTEPDIIVYQNPDERVAMVAVVVLDVKDTDKQRSKSITSKQYAMTLNAAKNFKAPLVLLVFNRANGRIWTHTVPRDELDDLRVMDTPHSLAKDDEVSGAMLKENYREMLVSLGGFA